MSLLDRLAPGGDLEWTVSGSGLGGIADLRLLDTLGDGQRMDAVFHPQVAIRRGSTTLFSGDLLGWTGTRSTDTAATAINFDLAPTLRAIGMAGGLTDDCTVSITFHSVIASLYAAQQAPALGRVLGQGDLLRNTAVFSGTVAGALSSSSPAVASLALPSSTLAASIYAVNGVLTAGTAHAAYGDTVTYRIQLGLPLGTAHHVQVLASLAGLTGPFVFDATATTGGPAPGHIQFGPNATYTAAQPSASLAADAAGNPALLLNFGDLQPVSGVKPGTIDLLVSAPLRPARRSRRRSRKRRRTPSARRRRWAPRRLPFPSTSRPCTSRPRRFMRRTTTPPGPAPAARSGSARTSASSAASSAAPGWRRSRSPTSFPAWTPATTSPSSSRSRT